MNDTVESLLARAGMFRVLAHGASYPNAECRWHLLAGLERVAIFARDCGEPMQFLADLRRAWTDVEEARLAEAYSRLFIGQDAVVLHETAYGDGGRVAGKPAELADINGFYLAFGFDLKDEQRELPDHLGTELEFLSLLSIKQAYALAEDWPDKYEIARDAARSFLRDHLGRWAGAVRDAVAERGGEPAYGALIAAAAAAVAHECAALGVTPTPLKGGRPDSMQAGSFVCPLEHASAVRTN